MTVVHEVEHRIIDALNSGETVISGGRRAALVSRLVDLLGMNPGTTSEFLHSHVTADLALNNLEGQGIVTTDKKGEDFVELHYVPENDVPRQIDQPIRPVDILGESDPLWDQAAELNRQLLDEPDPATSIIRKELNAVYDQLGEIFNR